MIFTFMHVFQTSCFGCGVVRHVVLDKYLTSGSVSASVKLYCQTSLLSAPMKHKQELQYAYLH